MPRSIWSGAISFGLVNVPVKLYSAVSRKSVRFHQLHDKDGARIQQKRFCSKEDAEVPYESIVKGYEISPDRYVIIEPGELEALEPKKSRTIDIQEFVDLEEIDPIYYDHSYYLAPDTGASKAYNLLVTAMAESDKVAIARVIIRQKEYLAAIRASDGAMTMSTMIFHDEVVPAGNIDELQAAEEAEASDREVKMAQQLIESLSSDFEPEKYKDEYRERVLDLIERKAEGEEIVIEEAPEEPAKVPDLMAALEASIAAAKDGGEDAAKKKPARKRGSASGAAKKSSGSSSNRRGSREKAKK